MVAFIIDGNSYVHGFYAATQDVDRPAEFLGFLIEHFRDRYSAEVFAVFDGPGPTWRHERFPTYKEGREAKPPELFAALDKARYVTKDMGAAVLDVPGYEADDVAAALATALVDAGNKVVIFSRDKDYHQLLQAGRLSILKKANRHAGRWTCEYYTAGQLYTEHGLTPAQWVDYRALTGDPSDAWPGCPGIGEKAAKKILATAGTLEAAVELQATRPFALPLNTKQREALAQFDWRLGVELMTLRRHIPEVAAVEPADIIVPF